MTKRSTTRSGQQDAAAREGNQHSNPMERLRRELDAAAAEPSPDADSYAAIADWAEKVAQSGILRRAPLAEDALEVVAALSPPASVTAECRARLERERLAVRDAIRSAADLEADCRASSPSDLFHALRERAGISTEHTAALFGVTATTWLNVERKQQPWYQLPSERLPAFADAVREPIDRLVGLIALAARRALYGGIEQRALALGRFDNSQAESEARRDSLRVAFGRLQDENRGAARFLEGARRAAGISSKKGETKHRRPGP